MEQRAQIQKILDDGTAQVILRRESACSGDCHKCAGCGAVGQTMLLTAQNPIGAAVGDWVIIRSNTVPVLRGAMVLYILPLVLFFAGYALGSVWNLGIWFGGVAFGLAMAGVVIYDRLVSAREKSVYTIIGYWDVPDAGRKGDNEID